MLSRPSCLLALIALTATVSVAAAFPVATRRDAPAYERDEIKSLPGWAGAVDARACGASQAWLVLNSPDGAKHKTKVCAPVLDGVAVLELGRLASSTSRGIKEQREAGKFSFQIVFIP